MNLVTPGTNNPFVETQYAMSASYEEEEEEEEEPPPSFSDPEDFVDEVTDEELLPAELLRQRPVAPCGAEARCVVVDNVPLVGPDRLDKLRNLLLRIFSQYGAVVSDLHPQAEAGGATKGYAFLEYGSVAEAREAARKGDKYKLDKQHTLAVHTLADFDRYMAESEGADWEPSSERALQPYRDTGDLQHWLLDAERCDQYSVIYEGGQRTTVFSCNVVDGGGGGAGPAAGAGGGGAGAEPVAFGDREMWTGSYVRWSPRGTYLATFHPLGVALWGGESFKQIQRFNHQGVTLADFSPCERYVATYSQPPPPSSTPAASGAALDANKEEPSPQAVTVHIWDIRSGGCPKRTLQCESGAHWPVLKWSHDGRYVARMGQDALHVYETPSMGLLDQKSMKVAGLKDFAWSPADNTLAYWVQSLGLIPARVTLVQIPSRQELAARKAFNVVDCKLHWQRAGDYLCVKMDKRPKGTQGAVGVTNLNIFRVREKLVPVDVVELQHGESVAAFALEPNGGRLAVLHGEAPGGRGYSASVYRIGGKSVELLKTLANQQANALAWSPRGQFLVLAGLQSGGMSGQLAFVDAADCTVMNAAEHYTCGEVEWDPTGRYVATSVSWWQNKVDTAYWLWSFQGRLLQKNPKERFCQMLWRPRPPSLLSGEQVAAVARDLERYAKMFEQRDRLSQSRASKEQVDRRRDAVESYGQYREGVKKVHRQWEKLRGGNPEEDQEETVEILINEERIPL